MVRLGFPVVSIYRERGVTIENHGRIVFHGKCSLGGGAALSVGPGGQLDIGAGVGGTVLTRIVCYHHISLGADVRFGWDCLLMDTDFHCLTKADGSHSRGYAPIEIGAGTWLGNGCRVMKRTTIPERCVVQAGTTLSEPLHVEPCSVIGYDRPLVVKARGLWRNVDDDDIHYPSPSN